MTRPISASEKKSEAKGVLEKDEQELIFLITKELIKYHFSNEEGNPRFQKINKLKSIGKEWYNGKVLLLNISGQRFKRLLYFEGPKKIVDHIARGINQ